jgi:hypothetical protein
MLPSSRFHGTAYIVMPCSLYSVIGEDRRSPSVSRSVAEAMVNMLETSGVLFVDRLVSLQVLPPITDALVNVKRLSVFFFDCVVVVAGGRATQHSSTTSMLCACPIILATGRVRSFCVCAHAVFTGQAS